MASELWIYTDGEKIRDPLTPKEAKEFGWHCGVEYPSALDPQETKYALVQEWCEQTFEPNAYRMFVKNVWFRCEQDALFCILKWS